MRCSLGFFLVALLVPSLFFVPRAQGQICSVLLADEIESVRFGLRGAYDPSYAKPSVTAAAVSPKAVVLSTRNGLVAFDRSNTKEPAAEYQPAVRIVAVGRPDRLVIWAQQLVNPFDGVTANARHLDILDAPAGFAGTRVLMTGDAGIHLMELVDGNLSEGLLKGRFSFQSRATMGLANGVFLPARFVSDSQTRVVLPFSDGHIQVLNAKLLFRDGTWKVDREFNAFPCGAARLPVTERSILGQGGFVLEPGSRKFEDDYLTSALPLVQAGKLLVATTTASGQLRVIQPDGYVIGSDSAFPESSFDRPHYNSATIVVSEKGDELAALFADVDRKEISVVQHRLGSNTFSAHRVIPLHNNVERPLEISPIVDLNILHPHFVQSLGAHSVALRGIYYGNNSDLFSLREGQLVRETRKMHPYAYDEQLSLAHGAEANGLYFSEAKSPVGEKSHLK